MRRLVLSFVVIILCICVPKETILAKGSRYPGQELNGTWQVVKNDIPFEGADEVFLPVGQKVAFWLTGDSHGYGPFQRTRTGMDIGMKLMLPMDKNICGLKAWDYLCDEHGNLNLDKNDIEGNAYVVTDESRGLLNVVVMRGKESVDFKKNWRKDAKNYYFNLNMNAESHLYDIHPMKNGNEILIFSFGAGVTRFPALLRRVK